MKHTWKTINETLGRHRREQKIPTSIFYDDKTLTDPIHITNAFNDYFSNIGTNPISTINESCRIGAIFI